MAETIPVPNFNDMDGYRTIVYDTEVVPDYIWQAAQKVQRESLKALLPAEEQDRADFLVSMNDFKTYRDTRGDPNLLVGNGWNDDQLFRRPKLAATFDRSNQLVGGVLTADNSSARLPLPKPLRPIEYWAKMLLRPGVPVPVIGNRRYDHLREVFTHPDAQERLETEDDTAVVSGIALAGIYYSIAQVNPKQLLVAYELPADSVDAELTNATEVMGMSETGYRRPHTLPGYSKEDKLIRVQAQVGQVMQGIMDMPGAKPAIEGMQSSRVTRKSIKHQEKELRKRNEKAYWRNYDARHSMPDGK